VSSTRLFSSTAEALANGRTLYNAGRFWDAHEAWEEAWLVEQGEVRLLLQGLIQITAGYHNAFVRRRAGGAVKLLASGLEKLGPLPDALGGLSLQPFRHATAAALQEVRRWKEGESGELDVAIVPSLESA
jgi:uncharacterized protein